MTIERSKLCHQLKISEKISETEDTQSIVLEIPDSLKNKFQYRAGQFVTFFMDINGEEVRRSYSLASSPDVDEKFKVSVKLVPNGKGSTYLIEKAKAGDFIWTTPPAGIFTLPQDIKNQKLVFFAGGSGITPIISLIKSTLKKDASTLCYLLFQNSNEQNIIFKDEIVKIEKIFNGRLKTTHILSNPSAQWAGPRGRIEKSFVRDFLATQYIGIRALYYICGPEGFMKTAEAALNDLNVPKLQIHRENFVSPTVSPSTESSDQPSDSSDFKLSADKIVIGEKIKISRPETLVAQVDGVTHTVSVKPNMSILENLLDAGLNPPYSCMDGACMACIAKVEEGTVYQNDLGILSDDNVEARECLTCQAHPAAKTVRVNYS